LENKDVIFFTGPVVSPTTEVRMPQPSDLYGQWAWTHHPAVQVWRKDPIGDTEKEPSGFPPVNTEKESGGEYDPPLHIVEGWLQLTTAPLTIRRFTVRGQEPVAEEAPATLPGKESVPARFTVAVNKPVVLSWTVLGADHMELRMDEQSLFTAHRHPLPTQYQLVITQDTTFTLVATGRVRRLAATPEEEIPTATKSLQVTLTAEEG
jgi:hypothetical protein